MQYVVQYHNDHQSLDDIMYGPYTLSEARGKMLQLVTEISDPLFDITDLEPGYAAYDYHKLEKEDRDVDLVDEIWVLIHELKE
jgi:hypothetical protein